MPAYEPIDWHIDLKSGYRYMPLHHSQLKYGTVEGADAKVSADLSRGYHLVTLAIAWQKTGNDLYRKEVIAQMLDWLTVNPYLYGAGWRAAMNVAIRTVNWITAFSLIKDKFDLANENDQKFVEIFINSIIDHRRFISANLEFSENDYHPNHYIANLAGLIAACTFLQSVDMESFGWQRIALRELSREINYQVLPDGFDFENATAYHALVLEITAYALILSANMEKHFAITDIKKWINCKMGDNFLGKLYKMFIVLRDITQPNGLIPLIGDCDSGRFLYVERPGNDTRDWRFLNCVGAALFEDASLLPNTVEQKHWTAAQNLFDAKSVMPNRDEQSCAYTDAGFYIFKNSNFFCMTSCGPIGTAGRGGHCHNDKLAVVLCIEDKEILIDPGIYVYTASRKYRDYYRSVFSHNTVAIGDQEQNRFSDKSQWWGCYEETQCRCTDWNINEEEVFAGEHYGYTKLDKPVVHRRSARWIKTQQKLIIDDYIIKKYKSEDLPRMKWSFILHPKCKVIAMEGNLAVVQQGSLEVKFCISTGKWEKQQHIYSPAYGVKTDCEKLIVELPDGAEKNETIISW
ncbi:MAG: alginate lyase family protein [Phycisphaerae bacterium]